MQRWKEVSTVVEKELRESKITSLFTDIPKMVPT